MSKRATPKTSAASVVAALTSTALTLPGYIPDAEADTPPEKAKFSYRFSQYEEEPIERDRLLMGSPERYEIDVHQLRLETAVGNKFSLAIGYQREFLTGASPWYTWDAGNGKADVAMSGASISEARTDVSTELSYYYDEGQIGVSLAASEENDYESQSWGLSTQRAFNDNHTRVTVSVSGSDDDVFPTLSHHNPPQVIPSFDKGEKKSRSVFAGVNQLINRQSVMRLGIGFTSLEGDLSDPYKLADDRPDKRFQRTFTAGYKHYLPTAKSALTADYRYFTDSWDIKSHTIDLDWNQTLTPNWQIIPSIRYYWQGDAEFFSQELPGMTSYYSNDYRLSKYEAITWGMDTTYQIGSVTLIVGAKWYESTATSSNELDKSPALVDFSWFTVGFDYTFDER